MSAFGQERTLHRFSFRRPPQTVRKSPRRVARRPIHKSNYRPLVDRHLASHFRASNPKVLVL